MKRRRIEPVHPESDVNSIDWRPIVGFVCVSHAIFNMTLEYIVWKRGSMHFLIPYRECASKSKEKVQGESKFRRTLFIPATPWRSPCKSMNETSPSALGGRRGGRVGILREIAEGRGLGMTRG